MPPFLPSICDKLSEESKTLNASLVWWVAHRKTLGPSQTQQIADADRTIQLLSQEISANALAMAENGCFHVTPRALMLHNYDPGGVQVSHSADVSQARAESDFAANPNNPLQLVGASKKFRNINTYDFWIAVYSTNDGGSTWHEMELPGPPTVEEFNPIIVISDPTVMWDDANKVYAAASAFGNLGSLPGDRLPLAPDSTGLGIAVYRSSDGGLSWPESVVLQSKLSVRGSDTKSNDDKMWPAFNPVTREMVLAWGFDPMIIAKTRVDAFTWDVRAVVDADGASIDGYAVSVTPLKDGSLAIGWLEGNNVTFGRSAFAPGDSRWNAFTTQVIGSGFKDFDNFPSSGSFPHFPGATFRIESMVTMASEQDTIFVAWPSKESDHSASIRYRYSGDGGKTWQPSSLAGSLLIPAREGKYLFQPQMAIGGEFDGIAITYYELDEATGKIHVYVTGTLRPGGVWQTVRVTDTPWDPKVDAILQHGINSHGLTFIGDYFGLASCNRGFFPLWMDTRTGIAEMYTARVDFHRTVVSPGGSGHPPFLHP